ncbi:methionyl-tRNA synthetase [Roseobacter sp. MED193]|uniref:hypothetical protein n=1 Tax=Roseobacter sp. MED193 TaxID=314262 RepID=UPI000068B8A8|nr:hypothetical protein [Roseobacter sp. MED193]EAQ47447.1 methionyl-tRNA synthetase [Roseobacter sp. MED193]
MSIKTPQTNTPRSRPAEAEERDALWAPVFAPSGALSGLCLEWILDKAEFNNGRPS